MIKAVIFDLDDTLFLELDYVKSGFTHLSEIFEVIYGLDQNESLKELLLIFKKFPQKVFNVFLEQRGISFTREEMKHLVNQYRTHFPKISFFEDVIPTVRALKAKEIKTGIITDGYREMQGNKLEALKAKNYIDQIIMTDALGREFWKPHPKAFELMRDYFNVRFDEMIYVGDNPKKDFYISALYPIKTIKIRRENGIYGNLEDYYGNVKECYKIDLLGEVEKFCK